MPALNLLGSSGPDMADKAMYEILNRDRLASSYLDEAERMKAGNDQLGAARAYNKAMEIKNRSTTDTINEYTRAWGEIVQGLCLIRRWCLGRLRNWQKRRALR